MRAASRPADGALSQPCGRTALTRGARRTDELRAVFDKFGEVAIKEGVSDGNGGERRCCRRPRAAPLATGSHAGGCAGFIGGNYAYGFNGNDIFASFFGTSNPFASIVEGAPRCPRSRRRRTSGTASRPLTSAGARSCDGDRCERAGGGGAVRCADGALPRPPA